jgi:hypothetical protein
MQGAANASHSLNSGPAPVRCIVYLLDKGRKLVDPGSTVQCAFCAIQRPTSHYFASSLYWTYVNIGRT